jgi:hypothetical protein
MKWDGIISFIYLYPNVSLKYHFCYIAMHYILHVVLACAFEMMKY